MSGTNHIFLLSSLKIRKITPNKINWIHCFRERNCGDPGL